MATETAERIPAIVRPAVDPETLWRPLNKPNPKIVSTQFANAVDELLSRGRTAFEGARHEDMLKRLELFKAQLDQAGNDVPFQTLDATRKEIGAWTRSTDPKTQEVGDRLYKAIFDDYEANATLKGQAGDVAQQLKAAVAATRDQHTAERLEKVVADAWGTSGDLTPRIRPGAVVDKIRKDPVLQERLTSAQQTEIREILESIKGLPAPVPARGVQFGSGPSLGRGGAVYGLTHYLTGDPSTALVAGGVAAFAAPIIGRALQTDAGRAILRKAIAEGNGQLSSRALVAIANVVRAPTVEPGPATVRLGQRIPR